MDEGYSIYSEFDAEKHKKKYVNYLEVLILEDGKVVYAVPSHQEKAIAIACERHGISREKLIASCPAELYFDYMTWLLEMANAVAVWNFGVEAPRVNRMQVGTLRRLKMAGLYKGQIPEVGERCRL